MTETGAYAVSIIEIFISRFAALVYNYYTIKISVYNF